jgi:hypothetical protein
MVAAELSAIAANENEAIIAEVMMRDAGACVLLPFRSERTEASAGRPCATSRTLVVVTNGSGVLWLHCVGTGKR